MGLDAVGTYTLICTAVEEVIRGRPYAASSPPRTIALTVVCTEPLLTQKYAGACSAAGMSLHERPNWLKKGWIAAPESCMLVLRQLAWCQLAFIAPE